MKRGHLETYPIKILLAFVEAVGGNEDFFEWLMKNGYPELGVLSKSIRGGEVSNQWLMEHQFPQFAAFDAAIHRDLKAILWLKKYHFTFLIRLADASRGSQLAINWFLSRDLKVFVMLAAKIKSFVDHQTFDVHKRRF
ncbi:MAG: hypothetical protein JW729_01985 [Bacteroidales bacterium]|nr:hypothetical protein [Bacteroidales bacterium]